MNTRRFPELQACIDELVSGGATGIDIRQGRHFVLSAVYKGRQLKTTVARTASDHRARKNSLARVRRLMRETDHQGGLDKA